MKRAISTGPDRANRANRDIADPSQTGQTGHIPLGVARMARLVSPARPEHTYAEQVRADIARRAALVAHCRHDWRECVRVLVAAKEIEGFAGRGE